MPGKEEFHETLRYFRHQPAADTGSNCASATRGRRRHCCGGYDEVVLATGIRRAAWLSRAPTTRACCQLSRRAHRPGRAGARVAIIGAGGIGFDVAEFLAHAGASPTLDAARWTAEWGVDPRYIDTAAA